jgi:hypothetical protein
MNINRCCLTNIYIEAFATAGAASVSFASNTFSSMDMPDSSRPAHDIPP